MFFSLYLLTKIFQNIRKKNIFFLCEHLTKNGIETIYYSNLLKYTNFLVIGKVLNIILVKTKQNNPYIKNTIYKVLINNNQIIYAECKKVMVYSYNIIILNDLNTSYFLANYTNIIYNISKKICEFSDLSIHSKYSNIKIIRITNKNKYIGFVLRNFFKLSSESILDVAVPSNRNDIQFYYTLFHEMLLVLKNYNNNFDNVLSINNIIKYIFCHILKIKIKYFCFNNLQYFNNNRLPFPYDQCRKEHVLFTSCETLKFANNSIIRWILFINGFNIQNISINIIKFFMIFMGYSANNFKYGMSIYKTHKQYNSISVSKYLYLKNTNNCKYYYRNKKPILLNFINYNEKALLKNFLCLSKNILKYNKYHLKVFYFLFYSIIKSKDIYSSIKSINYVSSIKILSNIKKINSIIGISKILYLRYLQKYMNILKISLNYVNSFTLDFIVKIPSSRLDIKSEQDLLEELLRIVEINNIKPRLQFKKYIKKYINNLHPLQYYIHKLKHYFLTFNFNEAVNYSFGELKSYQNFTYSYNKIKYKHRWVHVSNPLVKQYEFMRQSLIPGLVETISINIKRNLLKELIISFFEVGKVFKKINKHGLLPNPLILNSCNYQKDSPFIEEIYISGVTINHKINNYSKTFRSLFFYIKYMIHGLFRQIHFLFINWHIVFFNNKSIEFLDHSQQANVFLQNLFGKKIFLGYMGEYTLFLNKTYNLMLFEINLSKMFFIFSKKNKYANNIKKFILPKYPFIKRMLSIIVFENISSFHILKCISKLYCCANVLNNISIIDIYKNSKIFRNQKSLLFSFIFQSSYETLTDFKINTIINNIIKYVINSFSAIIKR